MTLRATLTANNVADVAGRIVEVLRDGGIVGISRPEERCSLVHATDDSAVAKLDAACRTAAAGLLTLDGQAAADWCVRPLPNLDRLMRGGRGSLRVTICAQDIDESLLESLPSATRGWVVAGERLSLCPPADGFQRAVARRTSDPVLIVSSEEKPSDEIYDMLIDDSKTSSALPTEVALHSTGWELTNTGSVTLTDVKGMMAQRIVFVCTGNTCRSPIAEAMFRAMLSARLECRPDELPERGFEVASAGLAAEFGAPANPESVRICAEQGADLSQHRSRPLTVELLEQADRLYTMTAGHREAIVSRHPNLGDRVEILSRSNEDVTDPIGCGREAYERSFLEITENLRVLVDELTV